METVIYSKESDLPGEGNWRFYWREQSCLAFMSDDNARAFAVDLEIHVNEMTDDEVKLWIEEQNLAPAI